jgi:4-hydroxybenzoate polyprenyltransferase
MKKVNQKISFKEALRVARPFWWVNTAVPFVVGYLIGRPEPSVTLLVGTAYFAFMYNLFMYGVNDIYDYESDIKNPRKVGIEGSVMPKAKHPSLWRWVWLTNVPVWAYFAFIGDRLSNVWLALIIFMAFAYSLKGLRFKEIPFIDSFTSAFHYSSPFIFGLLLSGASYLWLPAFITFYVWIMANHAFGAIQDVTPDKEAGIGSIAVSLGTQKTILFCLGLYALAAVLPIVYFGKLGIVPSLLLSPYVYLVARTMKYKNEDSNPIFKQSWRRFLFLNYVTGAILSIYLISLITFGS